MRPAMVRAGVQGTEEGERGGVAGGGKEHEGRGEGLQGTEEGVRCVRGKKLTGEMREQTSGGRNNEGAGEGGGEGVEHRVWQLTDDVRGRRRTGIRGGGRQDSGRRSKQLFDGSDVGTGCRGGEKAGPPGAVTATQWCEAPSDCLMKGAGWLQGWRESRSGMSDHCSSQTLFCYAADVTAAHTPPRSTPAHTSHTSFVHEGVSRT